MQGLKNKVRVYNCIAFLVFWVINFVSAFKIINSTFPLLGGVSPASSSTKNYKKHQGKNNHNMPLSSALGKHKRRKSTSLASIYSFESDETNHLNETSAEVRNEIRQKRLAHADEWDRPKDDCLLKALERKEKLTEIPVWIMRQAGRYLPEFHSIRNTHPFFKVCEDPYLASEVTLQPLRRFENLSAAIIFSDILVVPKAMGMPIRMEASKGPTFEWKIERPECIDKLQLKPNIENTLGYVFDAIYLTKIRLENRKPLIGFCGGPFTIFAYMIQGGGDKSGKWIAPKLWLYEHPQESHRLLQSIADVSVEYLVKQYDSGAHVLQVFDTNAGVLSADLYENFGAKYMRYIAEKVKERRPKSWLIGFPKGNLLDSFLHSKFDAFSFDERSQINIIRNKFSKSFALQGNLDPHVLYASPDIIRRETTKMVMNCGNMGYIANLGHGLEPNMKPENVKAFIDAVKNAI